MSKKYSSNDKMQNLFESFRKNINEVEIGGAEFGSIDIQDGARPDQIDIVNDLVDAMAKAGYAWAAEYGKNQTPEMASQFEMLADKLEDALIQAAKRLYKADFFKE